MKGSWNFGESIGDKRIVFTLLLQETDDYQKEMKLDALIDFLCDDKGYPRTVKISLRREPDKHFFARLDEVGESKVTVHTLQIQIYFTLTDPRRFSNIPADELTWGSEKVDFQSSYKLGNTGTDAVQRVVTGNTTIYPFVEGKATFPIITIVGSGVDVLIQSNNQKIKVGTFNNQTLRIDTEMYVAYVNGVEKIYDMDTFLLFPQKPITLSGTSMNFTLTLEYFNVFS